MPKTSPCWLRLTLAAVACVSGCHRRNPSQPQSAPSSQTQPPPAGLDAAIDAQAVAPINTTEWLHPQLGLRLTNIPSIFTPSNVGAQVILTSPYRWDCWGETDGKPCSFDHEIRIALLTRKQVADFRATITGLTIAPAKTTRPNPRADEDWQSFPFDNQTAYRIEQGAEGTNTIYAYIPWGKQLLGFQCNVATQFHQRTLPEWTQRKACLQVLYGIRRDVSPASQD